MDKLYTFTAYLFIVTCIATNCTAKYLNRTASLSTALQQMVRPSGLWGTTSWKGDIDADGYTIHIYGRMEGYGNSTIHANVTMLPETNTAKVCFSRKCNENQRMQLSDTCGVIIVYRQICNMSNACYSAIYDWVMPRCPTTNNGGQRCDIARINLVFKLKDGNQLNRTCIGPGELPCSCPPCQGTGACRRNCFIGCVCEAESKNSSGKTSSDTPTGIATPVSASGKTSSGTPTGTATSDPASSKTTTDGQDRSPIGVLVGGVVGGLFGGVVITVAIVFLCRACRSNRRHTEDEDGAGTKESHTYLGLIHTTSCSGKSPPGTNAVTAQVPDLIKVSAVQQASSAPSDVYDVIKEGDDNQLGVDPSVCDQGDYVDITDDMPAVGLYSLAQAVPGMAVQGGTPQPAEYFVLEKDDPTDGDYNKLVRDGATETGTDVQGTYNRLIRDGATETTTDVQGTYNKLGSTTYDNDNNESGRNIGTAADYFVLETPEATSNKLAQAAPGIAVQDGTQPSAAEYFVLEKDDPTDCDYNKLVRDGATKTTTDVQDTYNKLGSMADDNEDNEPGGNNGTAADYFVLEKPEDTYSKLEGKRSTEEEQEPYTKLGEATPKRESDSPDDPGGPSREYFILEDQT